MTLSSREDVIALGQELVAAEQDEVFYALLLDKGFRLLEARLLTRGVPDQVVVYPRSVVQAALQFGATRVILLHNHPGGNAAPSTDDVVLTQKIESVLGAIGIELIDHYIISGMEGYSILHRAVFAAPVRAGASRRGPKQSASRSLQDRGTHPSARRRTALHPDRPDRGTRRSPDAARFPPYSRHSKRAPSILPSS